MTELTAWLQRPGSAFALPGRLPELTITAAIERRWEMQGALMVPRQPEYLKTERPRLRYAVELWESTGGRWLQLWG